jgi:hypothetical protein
MWSEALEVINIYKFLIPYLHMLVICVLPLEQGTMHHALTDQWGKKNSFVVVGFETFTQVVMKKSVFWSIQYPL